MNYFDILLAKKLEDDRDPKVEGLSVTENGRYHEDGVVYDPVIVEVPEPTLISKSITANGNYSASADNADGYSSVSVNVPLPSNAYLLQSIEHESIATFTDGTDNFLKSLEVAIEPVQSGSGEPSPTNIRPISGWDEANVRVCGKNILKLKSGGSYTPSYRTVSVVNNEISYVLSTDLGISQVINSEGVSALFDTKKLKAGTYTFSLLTNLSTDASTFKLTFTDGTQVGNGDSFTLSEEKTIDSIIASTAIIVSTGSYYIKIQIEKGSQSTTYEPYNGHTITIDLDGTRYGGKLDVVNGVLTVDRTYVDLGSLSWGYSAGTQEKPLPRFEAILNNGKTDASTDCISSQYKPSLNPVGSRNEDATMCTYNSRVYICDSRYTDATAFKTAVNGVQLVYELATSIEVQLTPTIIKSLQGENNFFASTGEIERMQYWGKEQN